MPHYTGEDEDKIALQTEDYLTVVSDPIESSSSFTGEDELVVNEVFLVSFEFPVLPGENTITIVACKCDLWLPNDSLAITISMQQSTPPLWVFCLQSQF